MYNSTDEYPLHPRQIQPQYTALLVPGAGQLADTVLSLPLTGAGQLAETESHFHSHSMTSFTRVSSWRTPRTPHYRRKKTSLLPSPVRSPLQKERRSQHVPTLRQQQQFSSSPLGISDSMTTSIEKEAEMDMQQEINTYVLHRVAFYSSSLTQPFISIQDYSHLPGLHTQRNHKWCTWK